MEPEGDSDTNSNWSNPQRIGKGPERLIKQKTSGNYPNNSVIKTSLNTEKSPGDLTRLLLLTQLKDYPLTLVGTTRKE